MNIVDRILTILVTATLTSAVWIVAGGSLLKLAEDQTGKDSIRPAEAAPSPVPQDDARPLDDGAVNGDGSRVVSLNDRAASSDMDGAGSSDMRIPVLNVKASELTDTFTDERGGGSHLHEAIDIMAPVGTTIVAAAPGTIEKLFYSEAGGNTIYVRSADKRTIHYYAHMDEYAEGLKEGQRVRRGQRLGTVGSSGNATAEAPHLHFAILRTTSDAQWWEPANAVNPYPMLTGG